MARKPSIDEALSEIDPERIVAPAEASQAEAEPDETPSPTDALPPPLPRLERLPPEDRDPVPYLTINGGREALSARIARARVMRGR